MRMLEAGAQTLSILSHFNADQAEIHWSQTARPPRYLQIVHQKPVRIFLCCLAQQPHYFTVTRDNRYSEDVPQNYLGQKYEHYKSIYKDNESQCAIFVAGCRCAINSSAQRIELVMTTSPPSEQLSHQI